MPEGDTIFRTARTLHRALAGHEVTRFETGYAHLARVHDDSPVTGRRVERVEAAGKHVLMHFSGGLVLRTHMRMHGSWHIYRPGETWQRRPTHMRVLVATATWVAVGFNVPDAEFLAERDLRRRSTIARLGPDLLKDDFDAEAVALAIHAQGARPIADTLLDQRVLAGIGNIYKSEVLFLSGVHPDRASASLGADALHALLAIAVKLLRLNVGDTSGAGIETYRSLRRTTGRMKPEDSLWVYGRGGEPCRRCGTRIAWKKSGLDARSTYWCPACQPDPQATRRECV